MKEKVAGLYFMFWDGTFLVFFGSELYNIYVLLEKDRILGFFGLFAVVIFFFYFYLVGID